MSIAIVRSALKSQAVRELVGERVIDIAAAFESSEEGDGGILGSLFSLGKKLVGFVLKAAFGLGRWLLRNIWDLFLEVAFEVAYFDWAQTDADIQSAIQANNIAIAASAGQLLGSGSVWLVSVAVAGLASLKFPVLAGKIMIDLAREGGEEIRAQLNAFLSTSASSLTRSLILGGFLTLRRLRLFGLAPVTQPREPWTIAGAIEERVENIDSATLQAFVENFLEGAVESLIEVGYVVSYSIEDYYQSTKLANDEILGPDRGVKLLPDKNVENEFTVLTGPQTILQSSIETAISSHRWVHNRDVGPIVGLPAEDWLRAGVHRRKLTLEFKSRPKPPWIASQGEVSVKEVTITIPDARPGLTWTELKQFARPFTWGKYRCTANLDDARQMVVHGSSPNEAEFTLRELLKLSTAEILTLSITEEKDRHPDLRKEATTMYPAYACLLVRRGTATREGITDLSGQSYKQELRRMDLWLDVEPLEQEPFL